MRSCSQSWLLRILVGSYVFRRHFHIRNRTLAHASRLCDLGRDQFLLISFLLLPFVKSLLHENINLINNHLDFHVNGNKCCGCFCCEMNEIDHLTHRQIGLPLFCVLGRGETQEDMNRQEGIFCH